MGRLQTKATECVYQEYDRFLTEQFIAGLNNKGMISEILREVATIGAINNAMSEHTDMDTKSGGTEGTQNSTG